MPSRYPYLLLLLKETTQPAPCLCGDRSCGSSLCCRSLGLHHMARWRGKVHLSSCLCCEPSHDSFLSQHRLEHNDWDSARSPIIGSCGTQEQALLIDLTSSTCRRVRRGEIKRGDCTVTKGWLREGKGPRKRNMKIQALMDLREERYRRLAEPSGTGQVTLRVLSLGIPL